MSSDTIFHGSLPADLHYDPATEMWLRRLPEGRVRIGATSFGLFLAGEIIAFTPKPVGAQVDARRGLGTVETGKTVLAVRSPLTVRLLAGNDAAEENPARINADPYGAGWMVEAIALDWDGESPHLLDAEAYRAHCLTVDPTACIEVLPALPGDDHDDR